MVQTAVRFELPDVNIASECSLTITVVFGAVVRVSRIPDSERKAEMHVRGSEGQIQRTIAFMAEQGYCPSE